MRNDVRRKKSRPSRRKEKKSPGVMNIILVIVGICLLAFTIYMIHLFRERGAVPDTLVTCVFATLGGECGIMGWIKTSKERNRERSWEKEDRQEEKTAAREAEAAALLQEIEAAPNYTGGAYGTNRRQQ